MTTSIAAPLAVLVVDDSAFMRKMIAEIVARDSSFVVAGFARDGVEALEQLVTLRPDLMTLDLEMPQLDGLRVLERVMAEAPLPVVVLSAGGAQFGDAAVRALELGAVDFVHKPSGPISLDLNVVGDRLLDALRVAAAADLRALTARRSATVMRETIPAKAATRAVVLASSTGGPRALTDVVPGFSADLPAAVLVAQHMPRDFTTALARRLDAAGALRVGEAVDGELILEGRVYVAPGATHMCVVGAPGDARVLLEPAVRSAGVAPSGDRLFASAAEVFGADLVGVVLTGMGRDASEGLRCVYEVGGTTIVQDRATSVIYGMPQAALASVPAAAAMPIGRIAAAVTRAVQERAARV